MRAGEFVSQPNGYVAFIPNQLPPNPPVVVDGELSRVLSAADLALGRLDGITGILPNPDLFVGMYVKQEAVLSSQIEGTQASLTDVLQFEAGETDGSKLRDVEEVVNYVGAMNYGLAQTALPLSLRLIREIHSRLMRGVRGERAEPGEFRRSQNWIGSSGGLLNLNKATYVPPPPLLLPELMGNLEHFLHDETLPPLIHAAIAHAQFETIHPFLDGNGRVGRLLITFLLCKRGILSRPLLYLSHYLKQNRAEYYDRLQAIRKRGAWEEWLLFFLQGVREVATEAYDTARKILALRASCQDLVQKVTKSAAFMLRALDLLFAEPVVTAGTLTKKLGVSKVTANGHLVRLQKLGILREMTGYKRNRRFVFSPYLELFTHPVSAVNPEELHLPDAPRRALSAEQHKRAESVHQALTEFQNGSLESWIEDFERESDPEREILIWEAFATAFTRYCASRALSQETRHEVYSLLLERSWASAEEVLARHKFRLLSETEAQAVLDFYLMLPQPIRCFVSTEGQGAT